MKEIKFKLTKWGAEQMLSYYLGVDDWGCDQYDERKYNPIIEKVFEKAKKTGVLEIPEKYPELKNIFSCDMESCLDKDEMNMKWWEDEKPEQFIKNIGCSKATVLKTIEQYRFLIKEFDKNDD